MWKLGKRPDFEKVLHYGSAAVNGEGNGRERGTGFLTAIKVLKETKAYGTAINFAYQLLLKVK